MIKSKIVIYTDSQNDEFSTKKINAKQIDNNYKYIRNGFLHFIFYRIFATPFAYLHSKIKFHHKIVGKEKLKEYRKVGYFIYGNHTQIIDDAFIPNNLDLRKTSYIIVHPNNVSMKILGVITPYLGAIPTPNKMNGYKHFVDAIDYHIKHNKAIVIYPEAHIWPYYTKIREFSDVSFTYPCKLDTPVFCFTNTYQKRKKSNKVNITTYEDGPFFKDPSLPLTEQKTKLRDEVYNKMVERSANSNYEVYKYVQGEN